jgi:hypothetical protein
MTARASGGQTAPAGTGLVVKVLPYLTVVIAAFAPLAAGIYLLTSLAWSLGEREFFRRTTVATADPEVPASQKTLTARSGQKAR